ncbi:hypothetical protein J2X12_002850 [Pseudarthrobacter oxydans]|uniref:Uncharacterized protein n=1 Tax=Pseudarthrobacter oxydans TaxID=1671 RepID=A0AAW8NB20_PSEOX|nr:hypothetical protein [Pseudarthrobacter oxydans]MDR7164812.1 hypothetical protein [Pseudarthrobacter oxydans]
MKEPVWCDAWTSHDDWGEGERTFYHECGQVAGHEGKHSCFGHHGEWSGEWESCNEEWPRYANERPSKRGNDVRL